MLRTRTEELRIVFAPNERASEAITLSEGVKLQPAIGSIGPHQALVLIVDTLRKMGIDTTFRENGKDIAAQSLIKKIERQGGTWGHVETDALSFEYGVVASYEHCFIAIREKVALAAGNWAEWMNPFKGLASLVQGWVIDVEYDHWQNAKDPAEYENAGREWSHLPVRSNGLPPPVERMEIDISRNPGRWMLRPGYVEAIGSPMWLGGLFWDRVGRDRRARVMSASWLRVREEANSVVVIQATATDNCFASEDTASLQVGLRELLYG